MVGSARAIRIVIVSAALLGALVGYRIWMAGNRFNADLFEPANVAAHISELSSPEYQGRLAGSIGNERALAYVRDFFESIGLEPAGPDSSYDQRFRALVPQIDTNPVFTITGRDGGTIKDLVMYEEYRIVASGYGSGVDFTGELILVGHNLASVDPELLRDRVVVVESVLATSKKVEYVLENGGAGVLFVRDRNWSGSYQYRVPVEKNVDTSGKNGARMMVGNLGHAPYRDLTELVGTVDLFENDRPYAVIPGVRIRAEIRFPIVETMNLVGTLDSGGSRDRVLLLTAAMDGVGMGTDGRHFPGAVNNVSGIATLMEIARVISLQENHPYRAIAFAAWNAEENQSWGSRHYAGHPLYPLEKTTVIHLDALGGPGGPFARVMSDSEYGRILRSRLGMFARDAGVPAIELGGGEPGSLGGFFDHNVPGVLLTTGEQIANDYNDTAENVDMTAVINAATALLSYVKRSVYRDVAADYLRPVDRLLLWLVLSALCASSLTTALFNARPELKIRRLSIEQIYFHPGMDLLRRSLLFVLPVGAALFLLVLLVNLPPNGTVESVNGETVSNYSVYLSVKNSILFLKSLITGTAVSDSVRGSVVAVTLQSSLRSLRLIGTSLFLALCIGIGRSLTETSLRRQKRPARSTGTLLFASVPDVAIVLAALWLYVLIAQRFPELRQIINLKDFVLPLVTLTVLPAAYISRIASISIREELKKEYVRHARAKGYSNGQIFLYELMPAVFSSVMGAVPTLMTITLTNLIVVEYLFHYQGIIYYLLFFYKQQDGNSFITLAAVVGALYLLFTGAARIAGNMVNPMQRKGHR